MVVSKFHVFIALSLLVSEKTLAQDRVMIYPTIKLTYNNIQESSFLSSLQPQPFLILANWSVKRARALALATSNKESQASKLKVLDKEGCLKQETLLNVEVNLPEYIIMELEKRTEPILQTKHLLRGFN